MLPIIAVAIAVGLVLLFLLVVYFKFRGLTSFKENAIVPETDPSKINKFNRGIPRRYSSRQKSRMAMKKAPQFQKLQAIYETEIVHNIDELDIENQKVEVVEFVSLDPLQKIDSKLKLETAIFGLNERSDDHKDYSTQRSLTQQGSFSSFSMISTPRRSRTSSFVDEEKLEDISCNSSARSFQYVY